MCVAERVFFFFVRLSVRDCKSECMYVHGCQSVCMCVAACVRVYVCAWLYV